MKDTIVRVHSLLNTSNTIFFITSIIKQYTGLLFCLGYKMTICAVTDNDKCLYAYSKQFRLMVELAIRET